MGTTDKKNKYVSMYSWVSPDGDWYSCDFGSHSIKAKHIVCSNKNLMLGYLEFIKRNGRLKKDWQDCIHDGHFTPQDFLMFEGWCKMHNISGGWPIPIHKKEITQKQVDSIFDITVKFKFPKDPVSGQDYNWDGIDRDD